jgi:hypothetical protein
MKMNNANIFDPAGGSQKRPTPGGAGHITKLSNYHNIKNDTAQMPLKNCLVGVRRAAGVRDGRSVIGIKKAEGQFHESKRAGPTLPAIGTKVRQNLRGANPTIVGNIKRLACCTMRAKVLNCLLSN